MPGTDLETIPISRLSVNYYLTYANLPITGVRTGELGYATDRLVLYRWSGAAWQALTIHSSSGTAANIPAAANLPNGSLYYETDTSTTKQVQAGVWVVISSINVGEGHINLLLLANHIQSVGQGTWATSIASSPQRLPFYLGNGAAMANLDNVTFNVFLAAGTYTFSLLYIKEPTSGILDIDIDGVEVGSVDMYAVAETYNGIYTFTGVVVAAAGLKALKLRMDGKNAASTNYNCLVTLLTCWRTA